MSKKFVYYNSGIAVFSPFIMRVDSGADSQFTVPTTGAGYNYTAYYYKVSDPTENGTFTGVTGNQLIIFDDANTEYDIEITGLFPRWYQAGNSEKEKLILIVDDGDVVFGSNESLAFLGASNMNGGTNYNPNQDNLVNGFKMYRQCDKFNPPNYAPTLSSLTNGSYMYYLNDVFNPPNYAPTLSSLTNGHQMHIGCEKFNPPNYAPTLSSLTDGSFMYRFCYDFDQDFIQNDPTNGTVSLQNVVDMFRGIKSRVIKLQAGAISNTSNTSFECPDLEVFELIDMEISFTIQYSPLLVTTEIDALGNSVADMTGSPSPAVTMTTSQYSGITASIWTNKNWTITQV